MGQWEVDSVSTGGAFGGFFKESGLKGVNAIV
jgi:hypothetical protein